MADVLTPEQRRGNMAAIKGKDTYPEMRVRRLLHRTGYRYTLHASHLPGKPDLVFPSRKKVIFVHGCYWHCHDCKFGNVIPKTNTAFWQEKRTRNVARDLEQEKALAGQGWKVFVVWECETQTKDLQQLAARLSVFLDSD